MPDFGQQLGNIPTRVMALRSKWGTRQATMQRVRQIRKGEFNAVAPELFSETWPQPVVANTIDEAAKAFAANLGVMPSISTTPMSMLSSKEQAAADLRAKIANHYIETSRMVEQQIRAADQIGTYGMATYLVYPDFDALGPSIRVEDSIGVFPVWNGRGDTVEVAHAYFRDWYSILADYPAVELIAKQFGASVTSNQRVEVIKHIDSKRVVVYLPQMGNYVLEDMPNPVGECWYECVRTPWLDTDPKGNYDDIIFVQLARHSLQLSLMSGVDQAVNAPLVVPPDVTSVPVGPQALIRTSQGANSIGRARLDMPSQAFAAVDQLRAEMHGSANPEPLSGSVDASVITGQGIKQLMGGYSSQIQAMQSVLSAGLQRVIAKAYRMDEKLFGSVKKKASGRVDGSSYQIEYTPNKDIAGDYSVDVTYGFAAGQDPNRAVVMLLQAQAAGLMSREYAMRNLPVSLNVTEEQQRIELEVQRDALRQALSAFAQSIPQIAASGGDPSGPVLVVAQVAERLKKGEKLEEIVSDVFAPPEPPPQQAPPMPGEPGSTGMPGAGGPQGFNASGLPGQMKLGLASEGPGGRPDLQQLFAGMTQGGNPALSAGVSRMAPAR